MNVYLIAFPASALPSFKVSVFKVNFVETDTFTFNYISTNPPYEGSLPTIPHFLLVYRQKLPCLGVGAISWVPAEIKQNPGAVS